MELDPEIVGPHAQEKLSATLGTCSESLEPKETSEQREDSAPETSPGPESSQSQPIVIIDSGLPVCPATPSSLPMKRDFIDLSLPAEKRTKLSSPDPQAPEPQTNAEDKLTKRQQERLLKLQQREQERLAREQRKEEERKAKIHERERKEKERLAKKEALEKEKEAKREEERLKRERKQAHLEEMKKKKEEERRLKEEERKAKEAEKKRKDELKERSQMRILNFFSVKPASQLSVSRISEAKQPLPGKDAVDDLVELTSSSRPGYSGDFLPFFIKRDVRLYLKPQLSSEEIEASKASFDLAITQQQHQVTALTNLLQPNSPKIGRSYADSEKLVQTLDSSTATEAMVREVIESLPPIKYLLFYENSKPPYIGTWCSAAHLNTSISGSTPLQALMDFDYDYDSDLDWQDGDEGDGEDIDDVEEGDDDEEEADEDEMDDFVDNNDTVKRRGLIGPLQSTTVWNDGTNAEIFDQIKFERLYPNIMFPIDPTKNYWVKPSVSSTETPLKKNAEMTPGKILEIGASPSVTTPPKPIIEDPKVLKQLAEFIKKNSDFTIGTLLELAKKEFKIYTKSLLKHTIQEVAQYNKKSSSWEVKQPELAILHQTKISS